MGATTNITAEDRRAATNVTTSQSGHRFEIQLGHLCNNRCVFCSSGQLTALKIARPVPIEPILEALEQARAAGATHLTFLGGEPTIHKHFLTALTRAVDLGFEQIVIFTNGVMFPHPGFIDSITALGRFEWRISIQGATEESHVATTGRAESFQRILHGLGELQRRGQLVTANMCVNERSYRSLPHYPELVKRYGIRQLHIDIVRPESTGERDEAYLRDIMPRYTDMAPYYAKMLEGFEHIDPEFDINIGNLPYCILPEWGSRIHHGGQETVTKSSDGEGLEDEMNKYVWQASLRTHLPDCEGCVFRSRCTGIFRVYLELHGSDEFKPLTLEGLAQRDPHYRNFVLRMESALVALRRTQAPADWQLVREISEDRRRMVEMQFQPPDGGPVELRFLAPGRCDAPVLQAAHFEVEANADSNISAERLLQLFHWVQEKLAISGVQARLAENATERACRRALLARGRQRVAAMVNRLRGRFTVPGWNVETLQWPSATCAEVHLQGPAEQGLAVRFRLGTQDQRSRLGVEFSPSEGAAAEELKPIIEEIVRVVRGLTPSPTATEKRLSPA